MRQQTWREEGGVMTPAGAQIAMRLGQVDEALAILEGAVERRNPDIMFTNHPIWDPIRDHPRFVAIRKRVGLSDDINVRLNKLRPPLPADR